MPYHTWLKFTNGEETSFGSKEEPFIEDNCLVVIKGDGKDKRKFPLYNILGIETEWREKI